MTQTTDPVHNQHSTRQIFRLPLSPGQETTIPLFNQRQAEHLQAISSYSSQQSSNQRSFVQPSLLKFLSKPTGHSEVVKCSSGIILVGTEEATNNTQVQLEKFLSDNMKSEAIRLELLSRYGSLQFDKVLSEFQTKLAEIDTEIISSNSLNWTITITTLGWVGLLEAKNKVLDLERNLLDKVLRTPYPDSWGYDDIDDFTDVNPVIEELNVIDPEYVIAKNCFLSKGFKAKIHKIERIQNVE